MDNNTNLDETCTTASKSMSTPSVEAIAKAQNELLAETVKHSVKVSKFYRDLYQNINTKNIGLDDLKRLPILSREAVEIHGKNIIWKNAPGEIFTLTTSGTSGNPLTVFRSSEEIRLINTLLRNTSSKGTKKLFLVFRNPFHGTKYTIDWPAIHPLGITLEKEENHIEAADMLYRKQKTPSKEMYPSGIMGTIAKVYSFTILSLEKGYNLTDTHVDTIYTTGDMYPLKIKKMLEEAWDAMVIDSYSLTEVIGTAKECKHCAGYHLDNHVIWEVIDPFSRTPVDKGAGFLCLTPLYPFVQVFPLIRYNTADLVEIRSSCSQGSSFVPLGRFKNSVFIRKNNETVLLLSSKAIREILVNIPDVARERMFSPNFTIPQFYSFYTIFGLEVKTSKTLKEMSLHIELVYDPSFYPRRARELSNYILDELLARNPNLERCYNKNLVNIQVICCGPKEIPPEIRARDKNWTRNRY